MIGFPIYLRPQNHMQTAFSFLPTLISLKETKKEKIKLHRCFSSKYWNVVSFICADWFSLYGKYILFIRWRCCEMKPKHMGQGGKKKTTREVFEKWKSVSRSFTMHTRTKNEMYILKRAWDQHAARTYKLIKLILTNTQHTPKKKDSRSAMEMGMENESKTKVCIITRSRNPIIMCFFLHCYFFLSCILPACATCRHSRNERINVSMWMFVFILHISLPLFLLLAPSHSLTFSHSFVLKL